MSIRCRNSRFGARVAPAVLAGLVALVVAGCSGGSSPGRPSATDTTLNAGLAAQRNGDLDTAKQLYLKVLGRDAHNLYALYNLGVIAQHDGKAQQALSYYQKALHVNPNYVPALFNEATVVQDDNPNGAILMYRRILQIQPVSPTAQFNLGLLEAREGQTQQANADLTKAVQEDPSLARSGETGGGKSSATASPAPGH